MARLKAGSVRKATQRRWVSIACQGIASVLLLLAIFPITGCVEQLLTVDSDPAGAVVSLNDQEVGRTPVTTNFKWYGYYDAGVRKDGYQTLKTKSPVIAPWWQFVPFDLFAEILPIRLTDQHFLHYTLKPITERLNDPNRLLRQGERLRAELETGANEPRSRAADAPTSNRATKPGKPGSRPVTGPATAPDTEPAGDPGTVPAGVP